MCCTQNGVERANTDQNRGTKETTWRFWKKRRYIVAIMGGLGFFNVYCLRVNMSMAIVAMTETKNVTIGNGTQITWSEFDWDNRIQGIVLSSFFYGYVTTQLLGGYIASRIGGRIVLGMAVSLPSLLTLITPWCAKKHVNLLIAVRILEGIFEGVSYPSMYAIWAKWAPPLERSRLSSIAFSGAYIGTVFAMPVCAYLTAALGWESIFYFFGTMGLIWFVFWMVFITDSPSNDKRITTKELNYILDSLENKNGQIQGSIPWKGIFTSLPVWALCVANFSENWGFYTLLTYLPKYLKEMLDYDMNSSGFISAMPYLTMFIALQFAGVISDWFLVKKILTTTQVRKLFACGSYVIQAMFMVGAAFWSDRIGTVACLTISIGLGAFSFTGFVTNYLEVGPQYAGILLGIGNTFGSLPGIISPILTGYIVKTPPTLLQWQTVFYIAAGVYLFGALVFGCFSSGKVQKWASSNIQLTEVTDGLSENSLGSKTDDKKSHLQIIS